jgi:teichuronic acid biosynthesis glycosyltransferase TuaC
MKSILIITNKYPNPVEPNVCVFVQQLVWSIADMGYACSVVVPMPINLNKYYRNFPEECYEITDKGTKVKLFYPKYISAGQSGKFAQKLRVKITTDMFSGAVDKVISGMSEKPYVLYSHFICPSGVTAARLGRKYNIPAFMAHGEATYSGNVKYGNKKLAKELVGLKGLIAVSNQNKDYCISAGIVSAEIAEVFPNGYRSERFSKHDKLESRKKFGFPEDVFIVGFCGSFDNRKGVLRVQEAVDQLDGVYFACAGKGKQVPTSGKCLWAKSVNNNELAWFYSAIDVFTLPTEHEGCCNAIVEAIACGCPIISSNRSFNLDICDSTNSILVDPDNVDEIRNAIQIIKNNSQLRKSLSNGSLERAKSLTLEQRAKNIIEFFKL